MGLRSKIKYMAAPQRNYVYDATLIKNYDGDTLTVLIDQGFRDYTTRVLRLSRIDTPERRQPTLEEGKRIGEIVNAKLSGKTFRMQTFKDNTGSWNRYIAEIWIDDVNLSDWLLEKGYAVLWEG